MDIVQYTENEIRKNLALLENHLKQAPFSDASFCGECINKHIMLIEGLAEEGLTACTDCDTKKYGMVLSNMEKLKDQDYQKDGVKLSQQMRRLRKIFVPCTGENVGMKDRDDVKGKIKELQEELKLANDPKTKERLEYGIYLCEWFNRGRKCDE